MHSLSRQQKGSNTRSLTAWTAPSREKAFAEGRPAWLPVAQPSHRSEEWRGSSREALQGSFLACIIHLWHARETHNIFKNVVLAETSPVSAKGDRNRKKWEAMRLPRFHMQEIGWLIELVGCKCEPCFKRKNGSQARALGWGQGLHGPEAEPHLQRCFLGHKTSWDSPWWISHWPETRDPLRPLVHSFWNKSLHPVHVPPLYFGSR